MLHVCLIASAASLPAVYFVAGLPQILCLAVYRNIFQGKMMKRLITNNTVFWSKYFII
jgi:hypothetical protein